MNHPFSEPSMTFLGIVVAGIVLVGLVIQFAGW